MSNTQLLRDNCISLLLIRKPNDHKWVEPVQTNWAFIGLDPIGGSC